jgi:ABC-type dipeptide/oligopeptide/nickel transport system permease component
MLLYIGARILRWSAGLLLILFVTYGMMYFGAGDPIVQMFLDKDDVAVDDVALAQLRAKHGLDQPFLVQFVS